MSDSKGFIRLRGVEVHNLKGVDLDIPHRKLVVFCGLSGSGKTSLALDTLYAEGQRRYIETFSAYTRQFFERLEKPAAELIAGIPPAIAVTHRGSNRSSRATVGTATEAYDYLRLLMAKIGQVYCRNCGERVRSESPESTADALDAIAGRHAIHDRVCRRSERFRCERRRRAICRRCWWDCEKRGLFAWWSTGERLI